MVGGRKLEFDKGRALEAAMRVFWKKGFNAASVTDLTGSMGINKPSLYATFGNKEALFVQATRYYLESRTMPKVVLLSAPDQPLRIRLKNFLMAVLHNQCSENTPKGCFISLCVAEAASESIPQTALDTLQRAGKYLLDNLTEFFLRDDEAREYCLHIHAGEKALFLITLLNGTAVMARAGKSCHELETVIERGLIALGLGLKK